MSGLRIETDDAALAAMFDWAVRTARTFVVRDGQPGQLDVSEASAPPYRRSVYRASYHAGYRFRSGYYLRDFAHQAVGAQLLGLGDENRSMLDSFIRTATPEHGGWPVWALNFDRVTPLAIDYHGPERFVRELPAVFELVELVNVLYRWTGDRALLGHRDHWRRTLGEFVATRDRQRPNGVAEAGGPGIFDGAASYNERPGEHLLEAGDGIAAQYAALRHAAELERALGWTGDGPAGQDRPGMSGAFDPVDDADAAAHADRFRAAAAALADEFAARWGRPPAVRHAEATAQPVFDELVSAWRADGTAVVDWLKEATWFLPLKGLLADDDPRCGRLLDAIDAACRDAATAPANIEALSYLPDLFLRHGRPDAAYAWMLAIHARRDEAHEVPQQGPNGDYPELSFALVGQIGQGLLGLEPDAGAGRISTRPALPAPVRRFEVHGVPFGRGTLAVGWAEHEGHWLENGTRDDVLWHPVLPRGLGFRDPHLGEPVVAGDLVRVRPGERCTVPATPSDRATGSERVRSTPAGAAPGR